MASSYAAVICQPFRFRYSHQRFGFGAILGPPQPRRLSKEDLRWHPQVFIKVLLTRILTLCLCLFLYIRSISLWAFGLCCICFLSTCVAMAANFNNLAVHIILEEPMHVSACSARWHSQRSERLREASDLSQRVLL